MGGGGSLGISQVREHGGISSELREPVVSGNSYLGLAGYVIHSPVLQT